MISLEVNTSKDVIYCNYLRRMEASLFSYNICSSTLGSNYRPAQTNLVDILLFVYAFVSVTATVGNLVVLYAIVKIKIINRSMFLVLLLCMADLGISAIGMPLCFTVFIKTEDDCNLDNAAEFFCAFFGQLNAYITAVIGYDCYLSMKYLVAYQKIILR